jgi:glutamate/tyrosine decarboxylase-like PLP-dependent enzyme
MIYASAPSYPQGVIDPIEELSTVAKKFDVGLHVDACLGGFVLPFARMLDYDLPKFDFECPGVTSMSADTHKYGYASKGTSVVLYRNKVSRKLVIE